MKKIVLIGDSIRLGYEKYVKEAFEGVAEVYSPTENCRFAEYTLRFATDWKSKGGWPSDVDVVHWNAGLWDVLRLFEDEPLTPVFAYENFIGRIDKRLHTIFPNAKIVFATSTSVEESGFKGNFKRFNKDIEEYNSVAIKAVSEHGTAINDLYAFTKNIDASCRSDATHFNTEAGAKAMGGEVVRYLCQTLGIDEKELAAAKAARPEIDENILGV